MNMFTTLVPKVEETHQFFSLLQILLDLADQDQEQCNWCVLEFAKKNSVTTVQRTFILVHHEDLPTNKSILKWYRDFNQKGYIHTLYSPSRR